MANYHYELSWKAAFKTCGYKQLLKDSFVPFMISLILVVLSCIQGRCKHVELIEKVCEIQINVMPAIISILIAGFAIWISFFLSSSIEFIKCNKDGINILNELNASFLIEIAFSVIGLIFTLVIININCFRFETLQEIASILNVVVLFLLFFISFSVVWWLVYIAKNLHNIAKFTVLYDKIKNNMVDN